MSSRKQPTRKVSSSRNQKSEFVAAEILDIGPEELDSLLKLEFESHKLVSAGSRFPTEFTGFKDKMVEEILLSGNDEKWLSMTRQLLYRETERRFYFYEHEVEAVSRILVAIEQASGILNLSGLELEAIPPLIKSLTIPILDISKNRIRDLQPIVNLQLMVLYASNNEIQNLEPIGRMRSLQELHLNNNQVNNLTPLISLSNLKRLYLQNNHINDTKGVAPLLRNVQLESIDLTGNYLDIPTDALNDIQKLKDFFERNVFNGAEQRKAPEEDKKEPLKENKVPPPDSIPGSDTPPPNSFASYPTGRVWITGAPEENLLDVEDVSRILYESISNTEEQVEQFFGLFGRWGRGKTHLWNFLKKEFIDKQKNTTEEKYIPVEFHAWKYQDTPGLWAYLYCELNKAYFEKAPNKSWRFVRLLRLNYVRGKILKPVLLWLGGVCLATVAFLFLDSETNLFKQSGSKVIAGVGAGAISLYSLVKHIDNRYRSTVRRLFTQMTSNVNLTSHLGLQHEIQEELKFLLKAWLPHNEKDKGRPRKRIFLFIDDIDRCSEDKIIQIVDYIRVLLHDTEVQSRITVLAAIDERILIHAIQNKYRRFIENKDNDATYIELCREYMDKLFLAGIKLGPLTSFEKEQVVSGFTRQYLMKEPVLKEKELHAEEPVSTPQNEPGVSFKTPKTELGGTSRNSLASELGGRLAGNIDPLFHELGDKLSGNGEERAKKPDPQGGTEEDYSLEPWEQNFLRKIVANTDLTPRGIRVYTHRYLLGKKLVEKALTNGKPSWQHWYHSADAKECFALKLLHYSFRAGVPELYSDYNNYIKNYDENNTVTETVYNLRVSLNQELGSIMYQVLTMIVAY